MDKLEAIIVEDPVVPVVLVVSVVKAGVRATSQVVTVDQAVKVALAVGKAVSADVVDDAQPRQSRFSK